MVSILLKAGATIPDRMRESLLSDSYFFEDDLISPYLRKIVNAGGFKAYAKAHRQKLVAMFARTRCFQPVPDDIVPLIVEYGFHVGF